MTIEEKLTEVLTEENIDANGVNVVICNSIDSILLSHYHIIPFIDDIGNIFKTLIICAERIAKENGLESKLQYLIDEQALLVYSALNCEKIRAFIIFDRLSWCKIDEVLDYITAYIAVLQYEVSKVIESNQLDDEHNNSILREFLIQPIEILRGFIESRISEEETEDTDNKTKFVKAVDVIDYFLESNYKVLFEKYFELKENCKDLSTPQFKYIINKILAENTKD